MINLEEVIVSDGAGIVILSILLLLRIESKAAKHPEDRLFDIMVYITLGALMVEIWSFLLDGVPGQLARGLQYASSGFLFTASSGVGLAWVLYVDYLIYRSLKRLKQRLFLFAPPFLLVVGMVVSDLFGAGLIFSITEENVYVRGHCVMTPYLVLFLYYASSFILAVRAVRYNGHVQFFPIHYFVIPCAVGTIVQGLCYGLAVGWFSVSIALMFIRMQLQNQNTFVDDLSGLYNRKYYLYFVGKIRKTRKGKMVSGIMLDVNHFKSINDRFGHTTGDDAIRSVGLILSQIATARTTAFRLSGDEFVVISDGTQEQQTEALMESIQQRVEQFNASSGKPYQLSLAMGYAICEASVLDSDAFLHHMDKKMYEAKAAYYAQAGRARRRSEQLQ